MQLKCAARLVGKRLIVESLENRLLFSANSPIVSGTVFEDMNVNLKRDPEDVGVAGVTVYLDSNDNSLPDPGEPSTVTGPDGSYVISGAPAGQYHLLMIAPTGYKIPSNFLYYRFDVGTGDHLGFDFGIYKPATASGTIFNDINANGVQDPGEEGVAGFQVASGPFTNPDFDNLFFNSKSDGSFLIPDATGVRGNYRGIGTPPSGWHNTTPSSVLISLMSGQTLTGLNFGVAQDNASTGSIAAFWYNDTDGNGIPRFGETIGSHATIYLDLNANNVYDTGEPTATVPYSPANGWYMFSGLAPGNYRVGEIPLTGTSSPQSQMVTVRANHQSQVNFMAAVGSISGAFFNDQNENGTKNAGEPGLPSFTAYIDANDNSSLDPSEISAISDASGSFIFTNVSPGTYVIREVPIDGWVPTSPGSVSINVSAGQVSTVSFGEAKPATTGTIAGTFFNDLNGSGARDSGEPGLANLTAYLDANNNGAKDASEISATTDANGSFSFPALAPGAYVVREIAPTGWKQTSSLSVTVNVAAGQVSNVSFAEQQAPAQITGIVFNDLNRNQSLDVTDARLANVKLFLDRNKNGIADAGEPSTVTDATGSFSFTGLSVGVYRVTQVTPAGFLYLFPAAKYVDETLAAGQALTLNFADAKPLTTGTISGAFFNDLNGNGVRGTTEPGAAGFIAYIDANKNGARDASETSATSDSAGAFSFLDIKPGSYVVREVARSGWKQISAAGVTLTVTAGKTSTIAFADKQITGSISGVVYNDLNANRKLESTDIRLAKVKLFLDTNKNGIADAGEPTVTTDSTGKFTFTAVPAGAYRVTQVMPAGLMGLLPAAGYTDVTLTAGQVFSTNFADVKAPTPGTISGMFFNDLNGNGVRNTGESGLASFTAYIDTNNNQILDPSEARVVSDATGVFKLLNIKPGTYTLREVIAAGWKQTSPAGVSVTVKSGQTTALTFANEQANGRISGTIFNDLNANGSVDSTDGKLANVRVFLDLNKNGVADAAEPSVLTDINGQYNFSGLVAGSFRVAQVTPAGYVNIFPTSTYTDLTLLPSQSVITNSGVIHTTTPASFSGTIFDDANGDRTQQPTEQGLANWRVYLDLNFNGAFDAGEPSVLTNVAGLYTFTNVATGRYLIRPDDPATWSTGNYLAWYATSAGKDVTGRDFAATHNAVLGGHIFIDANADGKRDTSETPVSGVQVYIDANNNGIVDSGERSITIGSSGSFNFLEVAPGKQVLRIVPPAGFKLTTPTSYAITLTQGQLVFTEDFGLQATNG